MGDIKVTVTAPLVGPKLYWNSGEDIVVPSSMMLESPSVLVPVATGTVPGVKLPMSTFVPLSVSELLNAPLLAMTLPSTWMFVSTIVNVKPPS